ncbi:YcxB family protein [Gilliamella sp. ESL0254]|uniref:YcxB family protein n=1 Tax=Gilliamella sp. ESL0254 TaxID=2705035 RepID=UPI00158064D1|nr:YcxB family protein [Gilliamella sp. ESL0254]NUF26439.1 YcxB family protein [Gilliamella sp. ESL0254]
MQEIVVEYHINHQYIQDSYYAYLGSLDEEFTQKLNNSIANNMRNFAITFDNEKWVKQNKDKNEFSTFYYSDLFQVHQAQNGFVFFINKTHFEFVSYDLFKPDDLIMVKRYLEPYFSKNQETQIAVIKNYVLDYHRIYTLARYVFRKTSLFFMIVACFFFLGSVLFFSKNFLVSGLLFLLSFLSVICSKNSTKEFAKNSVKTLDDSFQNMSCIFYEDRIEFIPKNIILTFNIKYSQFYKIEKFNKGYLFYIQKYACYLCFNEDFTPEQQQVLEDKLKQYQNYYQK